MAKNIPRFETFEDDLRLEKERADLERQRQANRDAAEEARTAALLSQLRRFCVERGELRALHVLFNVVTGQAAVSIEKEGPKGRFVYERGPPGAFGWEPYKRVRAQEAHRLVRSGKTTEDRIFIYNFKQDVNAGIYPEWLFRPTDEAAKDWKPFARAIAGMDRTQNVDAFFTSVGEGLKGLFFVLLTLVGVAILVYFAYQVTTGVSGLLEFGRKQL